MVKLGGSGVIQLVACLQGVTAALKEALAGIEAELTPEQSARCSVAVGVLKASLANLDKTMQGISQEMRRSVKKTRGTPCQN